MSNALPIEGFVMRRFKRYQTAIIALRARLLLVERGGVPDFKHAGGDVVCSTCGLVYHDHPKHPVHPLTVLCSGELVKL